MKFNHRDMIRYDRVKEGDYDFVVVNAEDTTSQSGNAVIAMTLQVDVEGREQPITVFDHLVNTPQSLWKL